MLLRELPLRTRYRRKDEVKERRQRRRKQLLDDVKEKRNGIGKEGARSHYLKDPLSKKLWT